MDNRKKTDALIIADKELAFQNSEKEKRAAELIVANKELVFQNREKEKRADELVLANKELAFQNEEKEKRAVELHIANKELAFQNREKERRADELILANKELAFQNREKEMRAEELIVANKELAFQNSEKEKRAEELIAAKEKAEESDRLKSTFLANMSHEIRTPLNGIMGFIELLRAPELNAEERNKYIAIIEKSGARLLTVISDIMSISKVESGLMGISVSETNINEQIEFIYNFFKPEVEQKGMQLSYQNALPDEKAMIKTDRDKIYAILTNLVKNAIKFTSAGSIELGYTVVETRHAVAETRVETRHALSLLQFFVKDTGIGISPEQLDVVFLRFRQGSESLNRKYEGAGLGLTISKAFVEMLGGEIWIESEPGKGSAVYFTIPYTTETEEKIVRKKTVRKRIFV
jgi:hypothetical protein